jgi:hypothetical protein
MKYLKEDYANNNNNNNSSLKSSIPDAADEATYLLWFGGKGRGCLSHRCILRNKR